MVGGDRRRDGFIVPERRRVFIGGAVRRLLAEPALVARLGDQTRQDARRFDYKAMADAFEAAIEHTIAARR